jgi:uncharacterized iron-regulated membrane protein
MALILRLVQLKNATFPVPDNNTWFPQGAEFMPFRRVLFWAHLVCGVSAGLLILLMAVTGTLLTYEHQMVEAAARRNHVQMPAATPRLTIDALAALARGGAPAEDHLNLIIDADPSAPVTVVAGRKTTLLLNPYTGEAIDDASTSLRQFFRTVEDWHRWMGAEPRSLRAGLLDIANLIFLFIIVSGAYLWLPAVWRWRTLRGLMLPKLHYVNAKVRDFNWHHVFSFWMLVPLLLIASSGVVFSYSWANNLVFAAFGEEAPRRGGPPPGGNARGNEQNIPAATETSVTHASLQQLLTAATSNIDNWQRLTLPTDVTGSRVEISAELKSDERRAPRRNIELNAVDGSVINLQPPPGAGPAQTGGQRARLWFRFIHTGEQYGVIGQTIAGLASLAACFLVYTGLALAWRRLIYPLFRTQS